MSSTKIFVLKLKEIIYATIFIALGVILIILLVYMFTKDSKEAVPTTEFKSGIYTSSFLLDNQPVNIEVTVDSDHINSVKIKDLNQSTEVLYPLLKPAMSQIETQLINDITISTVQVDSNYTFTSQVLLEAIEKALAKARITQIHN